MGCEEGVARGRRGLQHEESNVRLFSLNYRVYTDGGGKPHLPMLLSRQYFATRGIISTIRARVAGPCHITAYFSLIASTTSNP